MSLGLLLTLAAAFLAIPALLGRASPSERTKPWPSEVTLFLRCAWWINRAYCLLVHRLVILNEPQLPDSGPAMLIANHTSGIDHFIVQAGCRRVLGFMIAREFYDVPVGNWFCRALGCIPVKRDGRDGSAAREALRALESGRVLPIFPEGKITRASGREFAEGKLGAAFLAWRSRVPVIPAYIRGTPTVQGVWAAWFTPSRARVIYGPPIDLSNLLEESELDRREERVLLEELTLRLMDAIKALRPLSLALEPETDVE
ncbi:MAG: lysophospholipid acyltransferase family protein [Isosphaeraceae bacterium]|nr:lysophospholipid acyltransferase family protein [Isosphaeraceae bacterium]